MLVPRPLPASVIVAPGFVITLPVLPFMVEITGSGSGPTQDWAESGLVLFVAVFLILILPTCAPDGIVTTAVVTVEVEAVAVEPPMKVTTFCEAVAENPAP